ncbi:MAG: PDZ domain-containing protein [Bryobacteraceae bacterium]|jgi:serine protease Do
MTTKLVWAVALLAGGALAPASRAQNPAPRAHAATIFAGGSGSYLGVGVLDVDSARARALKLKEERGVEISSVTEGGPADKAGIKQGDVVLEYNGQPVEGMAQFQRLVHETPAGRQVKIEVWRNGAPLTLMATVETHKSFEMASPEGDINIFGNPPTFQMPSMPGMPPSMPGMPEFDMPHIFAITPSRRLGIEGEGLGEEPQFAEFLGVKDGVLVKSVLKNSAAEKAGIKAGDVITRIGDTPVFSSHDITNTLRTNHQNQPFTVTVVRNKKETQVTVTIEDRTGQNATRAAAQC